MQTNILQALISSSTCRLSLKSNTGHVTQIRNHVKMYPWRSNRSNPECHLDNNRTPYTDRHNINEFKSSKRQKKPWMVVIPKDKDTRFHKYQWHEAFKSDPAEAKETASSRMRRLQDSLRERGAARESKPYDPPSDVQERILAIFKSHLIEQDGGGNIESTLGERQFLDMDINQHRELKFNLITRCIEEFQHDLPTSSLNDVTHIRDLVSYYMTPVRGIDPYTALLNKSNLLPENLSIIAEAHRYDRENDDKFGGHSALPGVISKVPGLRASKKYPILNQDEFQWPDI